jgi:hypothetical protein
LFILNIILYGGFPRPASLQQFGIAPQMPVTLILAQVADLVCGGLEKIGWSKIF